MKVSQFQMPRLKRQSLSRLDQRNIPQRTWPRQFLLQMLEDGGLVPHLEKKLKQRNG